MMIEEVNLEVRKEGGGEVVLRKAEKKNLLVLDFPIFRIESAFAEIKGNKKKITVIYEEEFPHFPVVHFPCMTGVTRIIMGKDRFEVTFVDSIRGVMPYTAIGRTTDVNRWELEEELEKLSEKLRSETEKKLEGVDLKIAGGATGGAFGGVVIEELLRRLV